MKANARKSKKGARAGKTGRTENIYLRLDPEGRIFDYTPLIRLTGQSHAEIERHKGVLEFGNEVVRIYTALGIVKLTGENLKIRLADRETVVCDGKIRIIEYENP